MVALKDIRKDISLPRIHSFSEGLVNMIRLKHNCSVGPNAIPSAGVLP
jgi:hypothetical protein